MSKIHTRSWWGAPRKLSFDFEERKISWLELFYDLVYVIAVSKITHHLSENLSISGFLDYIYSFALIFWGWFNGSLYYEIHGTKGLRTYLMNFWQITIVAALIVTLNSPGETYLFNVTVAIMVMQVYITYLWWSVGIYDQEHRQLNKIYTIVFLISLALMFLTLFLDQPYVRLVFYLSLVLNYLPPFLSSRQMQNREIDFSLPPGMSERLGLFTIIVFGEVVLGVVNGVSELHELHFSIWINFIAALMIVFVLWWIFFSMLADKESKKERLSGFLIPIFYIPALMALDILGVSFSKLFHDPGHDLVSIKILLALAIGVFLLGIVIISHRTLYPGLDDNDCKAIRAKMILAIVLILILSFFSPAIPVLVYLILILLTLMWVVIMLNLSTNKKPA